MTVESRMVDSFFGNISYRLGDTIFISQTGSSLDELEGHIDPCPVDGTSTTAITASSEFSAHKSVYNLTGRLAILHGHPKFCVILSMMCDREECPGRGTCHTACKEKRYIDDIPIVPGEVGTGPTGLCNTLPPSLTGRGSIVWGHGLFTTGAHDFRDAFASLIDVERKCLDAYQQRLTDRL
jgi:ribulose-5-phosphate 4-epimerase/fuculose-1-phosphate aldolase